MEPWFQALFYGQMSETRMGHVTIEDMQPVIFKALLRFIYTGSLHGMILMGMLTGICSGIYLPLLIDMPLIG